MSEPLIIAIIAAAGSAVPALLVAVLTHRKVEEVRHATRSIEEELARGALKRGTDSRPESSMPSKIRCNE
jgi:hypothetical protein